MLTEISRKQAREMYHAANGRYIPLTHCIKFFHCKEGRPEKVVRAQGWRAWSYVRLPGCDGSMVMVEEVAS